MPVGPKGQKRKADVIGNAVLIARIATGEVDDDVPDDGKDPAAKALGKKGGAARAKSMTPERRKRFGAPSFYPQPEVCDRRRLQLV